MKFFPFFVITALLSCAGFSAAMASEDTEGCSAYVPTVINVQPQFDETEYDYTTPMLQIKDLTNSKTEEVKGSKHSEEWPVGLSIGEMFFNINFDKLKMMSPNSQISCGQVSKVSVVFGFKNNKIYVAKEFPKRSCPFREVLRHEEMHKSVDRKITDEYTKKMQIALADLTKKIGMVKGSSPTIVDDKIDSIMNQSIRKITQEIDEVHIERQKKVDTKEEYKRVTDSCDGQTMEIVRSRIQILEETHPGITKAGE